MEIDSLKKQLKSFDLALRAARQRQSPRTGFVHLHWGAEEGSDTIPIYENFCFVLALYRQKKLEAALEAKELLEKLFHFQSPEGNFPVYLHEYPRCRDRMQALKITPLLLQLLRRFSSILSPELKQKITSCIDRMLGSVTGDLSPFWSHRLAMCLGKGAIGQPDPAQLSPADWTEWLISAQLGETNGEIVTPLSATLFHPGMQVYTGPAQSDLQEGFEPRPSPIEWLWAERQGAFSERLGKDHPLQLHLAALWPWDTEADLLSHWHLASSDFSAIAWSPKPVGGHQLRILWSGKSLHSFVLPPLQCTTEIRKTKESNRLELLFDLPEEVDQGRNDLFEIAFYCDASSATALSINGRKGTAFQMGDLVSVSADGYEINLSFELVSGEGDFLGHLSRANRLTQVKKGGFEAYDWQIGLRTLRRAANIQIRAILTFGADLYT